MSDKKIEMHVPFDLFMEKAVQALAESENNPFPFFANGETTAKLSLQFMIKDGRYGYRAVYEKPDYIIVTKN